MGYLNNQVITVDAILTKKGRELLAKGDGSFNITQFALSDDEVETLIIAMYQSKLPVSKDNGWNEETRKLEQKLEQARFEQR